MTVLRRIRLDSALSLGLMLLLVAMGGCSLVPTYERPEAPVADTWADSGIDADSAGSAVAADMPWQEFVQDADLRELIDMALAGNRNLRVSTQNIELARAQYRIRRADQLPSLGLSASGDRGTANPAMGVTDVASTYTVGLGISAWELDFFGRVAALKDVALANYLATEEARKAAQISLIASVSSTWLELKTDTELLTLAARTLATREQSLELMQMRVDGGASSALDLHQSESLVAGARAVHAQQRRRRAQDLNLLSLLIGQPIPERLLPAVPDTPEQVPQRDAESLVVAVPSAADLPAFTEVPSDLSSELLLRRPDIRAAEQLLIGANANIGAARANFFPRITLTGSLGRVSAELDGLFGSDGNRFWSTGAGLTAPIFDMGRNRANLAAAKAAREIAVAQYERAIQAGFREVADALVARTTYADQLAAQVAQTEAERERLRLSELRYSNGIASYLDLLDAQRSLFAIEQLLAQTRLAQRVSEVQLYMALGGGWSESQP